MLRNMVMAFLVVYLTFLNAALWTSAGLDDDAKSSPKTAQSKNSRDKPADKSDPPANSAASETGAEKSQAAPQKDPLEEWAALTTRKFEIAQRLRKLRDEFYQTDDVGKKKIRDEFTSLTTEFQFDIARRMLELAPQVYEKSPDEIEAAEYVMEAAFNNNRYAEALEIAEKLLAGKQRTKYTNHLAANIVGAANFALNNFEKCREILKASEEQGELDSEHGHRFLAQVDDYIEFWKKEQAIRDREDKATGDDRLPLVELIVHRGEKPLGRVEMVLFENEAPNTVANFISIVEGKEKNYTRVKFHRVIRNFMAQTGDFDVPSKKPLDYTIQCECYQENARKHFRGSVSMALRGRDTGDSQFFLTHLPTYWLNIDDNPDSVHTVFGRIVAGMDIVDRIEEGDVIASAKVLFKRNHSYQPMTVPNAKPSAPSKRDDKTGSKSINNPKDRK